MYRLRCTRSGERVPLSCLGTVPLSYLCWGTPCSVLVVGTPCPVWGTPVLSKGTWDRTSDRTRGTPPQQDLDRTWPDRTWTGLGSIPLPCCGQTDAYVRGRFGAMQKDSPTSLNVFNFHYTKWSNLLHSWCSQIALHKTFQFLSKLTDIRISVSSISFI